MTIQQRIDYHFAAWAHHFNRWYAASEYHLDLFNKACKEKERLKEDVPNVKLRGCASQQSA